MRFALSILGITLGLIVYTTMVYADFSDEYRYGNYWIIQSGANIYLGFTAFLVALLSSAFATWSLRMWIAQALVITVSLLFGMIGYLVANNEYHASWHPEKAQHWVVFSACLGVGIAFCFGFVICKTAFKSDKQAGEDTLNP